MRKVKSSPGTTGRLTILRKPGCPAPRGRWTLLGENAKRLVRYYICSTLCMMDEGYSQFVSISTVAALKNQCTLSAGKRAACSSLIPVSSTLGNGRGANAKLKKRTPTTVAAVHSQRHQRVSVKRGWIGGTEHHDDGWMGWPWESRRSGVWEDLCSRVRRGLRGPVVAMA